MVVKVTNQAYKPSKKLQFSKKRVYALEVMCRKIMSVHAAKIVFFLICFGSALLSRTVSVLTTRYLMKLAKSSPAVLKANMVMGIPMIQTMMVIPLPSCVLGVIFPYPERNNRTIL